MQWAYELDQAIQQELANGPPSLTRHSAQAHVEASLLGGRVVELGLGLGDPTIRRSAASPLTPEILRDWVSWLVRNWASILEAGDGPEVTTAPEWWYHIWATGAVPSANWVHQRPVLLWIATHADPGFRDWWLTEQVKPQLGQNRTTQAEAVYDLPEQVQEAMRPSLPEIKGKGVTGRVHWTGTERGWEAFSADTRDQGVRESRRPQPAVSWRSPSGSAQPSTSPPPTYTYKRAWEWKPAVGVPDYSWNRPRY
jgi:hypothetical protein